MATQARSNAKRVMRLSAQEAIRILTLPNPFWDALSQNSSRYMYYAHLHSQVDLRETVTYAVDCGLIPDTSPDVAQAVVKGYIAAVIRLASDGRSITMDGLLNLRLIAKGGTDDPYQPFRQGHRAKLYYNVTAAALLNQQANELQTETLGPAPNIALITEVKNPVRPSEVIFQPEDNISVSGHNIKVYPEDNPACGLFYINKDTGAEYRSTIPHVLNMPSQVISHIPSDAPAGFYFLEIRTQFTHGKRVMKKLRVVRHEDYLEIIPPTGKKQKRK